MVARILTPPANHLCPLLSKEANYSPDVIGWDGPAVRNSGIKHRPTPGVLTTDSECHKASLLSSEKHEGDGHSDLPCDG